MDEKNNVLWSEDDQIVAFFKTTRGQKYQVTSGSVGKNTADFVKVTESGSGDGLFSGMEIDHIVALYPYSSSVDCSMNGDDSYKLNFSLPQTQYYSESSFGNGAFPMLAVSSDNNIIFKNICGGLKLQFKGVDKIKSITFEGLGDELLSGSAAVVGYVDGSAPEVTMSSSAAKSVTLDCGDGVQLYEDQATTFIITLPPMTFKSGMKLTVTDTDGLSKTLTNSSSNTVKRSSLLTFPVITYKQESSFKPDEMSTDLSTSGTANCYIVSKAGAYKFTPTKGNSSESVGAIASAEVVWETFGTDVTPNMGDLVKNVKYQDGTVCFETPSEYKEGNALIAAKDAEGTILWSWHIWLTDEPQGQVYYNNAGIMMDRNLGATSATPGDVGALGLLYQWGRKDPFLSSSSVSSSSVAASTATWPAAVTSDEDSGTIEYAVANPMTFIVQDYVNYDWYYTGSTSTDNTRWTTSATQKSIYDPCPAGWRVPDGGKTGVWVKASKVSANTFDNVNKGMNFYGIYSSSNIDIWYPATGSIHLGTGELGYVGTSGGCWSASPDSNTPYNAYRLFFSNRTEYFAPMTLEGRANGVAVRCVQE